jgi:O-acetyl-ADP-ribose deacetylase (regulator of RNase III)
MQMSLDPRPPGPAQSRRQSTRVGQLHYITHVDNLSSILERGILCHSRIEEAGIPFTPVYDAQIVQSRSERHVPDGRSLWDFANLYFQGRNAMLYRVLYEKPESDVAVVSVRPDILNVCDYITTGNAASSQSEILPAKSGLKIVSQLRKVFGQEWWSELDGSKRKMMAECLVAGAIPADYIQAVYVASYDTANRVRSMIRNRLNVIPEPYIFFRPRRTEVISARMSIIQGDMFFSKMQTLTVSVNCVGIMGKGLASRAKYQFPDMYVLYQDVCRQRKLRMGQPFLYKRESSLGLELADDPSSLPSNGEKGTWLLLFPTKNHWRNNADFKGIEKGLQWVVENAGREGITSLAVPALGCGLGNLDWRDVGPLICRYLSKLAIPVEVYLPAERQVASDTLTREFLLGS